MCGEQIITVLPKLSENGEHTFGEEVVVKQANCYETGLVTKTCETCGYVEETVLGLTPHSYTIADAAAAGDGGTLRPRKENTVVEVLCWQNAGGSQPSGRNITGSGFAYRKRSIAAH